MSLMTKEWRFPEVKALLGPGPWQNEPDKMQWEDETTGLPCLIVRSPSTGALCGYVGVPKEHPWHGKDYQELLDYVEIHGGLTFSHSCDERNPEKGICHITDKEDSVWWLGFDCSHCYDQVPAIEKITGLTHREMIYRDIGYVRNEVTSLAVQIAEGDNR